MPWRPFPLDQPWHPTLDELALPSGSTVMENCYINEAKGHSRFPNLSLFVTLPNPGRVFLWAFRDELVAVTSLGRIYMLGRNGEIDDRTGAPVAVLERPTFAETDDGLLVAGGGAIIALGAKTARVLSDDAPETTHVAYSKGYVLAPEKRSGLVHYSNPGFFDQWDALNFVSAEDKPDPVTAVAVNAFNEILLAGPRSCEMYRTSPSGDAPFYQFASLGQGLYAPYVLCEARTGFWCVSMRKQLVALSLGGGKPASADVQGILDGLADWTGAWLSELLVEGDQFLILGLPRATTPYGGTGRVLLRDASSGHWSELYDWDARTGRPSRRKLWSVANTTYGTFAGGEDGKIYRLTSTAAPESPSRMAWRSAPIAASALAGGAERVWINDIRLRVRRRRGPVNRPPTERIYMRCRLDDGPWSEPIAADLEHSIDADTALMVRFGAFGSGSTVQLEYQAFSAAPMTVVGCELDLEAEG